MDTDSIMTPKIKKARARVDRDLINLAAMMLPLMETDEQRAEVRRLADEIRNLSNVNG